MTDAFRPLPGASAFGSITSSGVTFSAPSVVGNQADLSGNVDHIQPYNSVRIQNMSGIGVLVNLQGATATTSACDGAVPPNLYMDFILPSRYSGTVNLATTAGATQCVVSFGNFRK